MRIASFAVINILLLSFTSSALAQSSSPSHAPFIPSTLTSDAKIVIAIEAPDGRNILVPLALTPSRQERGSELSEMAAIPPSSWTFVPFQDASNQVVFSVKAVQDWTTDQH